MQAALIILIIIKNVPVFIIPEAEQRENVQKIFG